MKNLLTVLLLSLPLLTQAATTTAPASNSTTAMGMLAQLPAFLTQLDKVRGKALTLAEKTAVTDVVTQGNSTVNGVQAKFLSTVSKTSGLDTATLGLLFPSATKPVTTSTLTSQVESKLGKKLGYVQKTGISAANSLRNNSLDSLKTSLSNGVGQKLGMDPALVSSLLPLLGF
jgi:hypothetical protein